MKISCHLENFIIEKKNMQEEGVQEVIFSNLQNQMRQGKFCNIALILFCNREKKEETAKEQEQGRKG